MAEFIPFGVISTAVLAYFYLVLGTNLRVLISVINTHFQQMRQDGVDSPSLPSILCQQRQIIDLLQLPNSASYEVLLHVMTVMFAGELIMVK